MRVSIALVAAAVLTTSSWSITLSLYELQYHSCGEVSINGLISFPPGDKVPAPTWNWGDGTQTVSFFPATHAYRANGTYMVQVNATDTTLAQSASASASVSISGADDPSCAYVLRVQPTSVHISANRRTEKISVEVRDADGGLLTPSNQPTFSSDNPALIAVDGSGNVSGTGWGAATITVTVPGVARTATVPAFAGVLRLEPPIVLLASGERTTIAPVATNADGSSVDLTKHTIQFSGSNAVAAVDTGGNVTAIRPPATFNETPYLFASVDGLQTENACVVRVTSTPLGLTMLRSDESQVSLTYAQQVGNSNYQQIMNTYDGARVAELGFEIEQEATGIRPVRRGRQFLVNDPGHGGDGTVPCGTSGNPIRYGSDVDKTFNNSCLIVNQSDMQVPQFGVWFHEIGHDFTLDSPRFQAFAQGSPVNNSNITYVEGLATAVSMYTAEMLQERAGALSLTAASISGLHATAYNFPDLSGYLTSGANYSQITADNLDAMLQTLVAKYGYHMLYRFFSAFLPDTAGYSSLSVGTDSEQATFFAAAISAASNTDQRAQFRSWGFPISDDYYTRNYGAIAQLVRQRDEYITSVSPASILVGSGPLTLTVNGANFQPGAIVFWNGTPRATTFVNNNQVRAELLTSDVAGPGSAVVGVGYPPLNVTQTTAVTVSASGGTLVPQTGWWWDAKLNGTGFFIEYGGQSGRGMFVGGFLYDATGNNTWLVSTGPLNGNTYTSTWLKTSGGQTLTGAYKAPTQQPFGSLSILFSDSSHAVLTRPDGTQVNLVRFSFTASATPAAPEAGAPQSGWWWAGPAQPGTGYGVEIQGDGVFIVAYVYDSAGNPVWYLATGALTAPTSYSGTWDVYAGGPQLTSPEGNYSTTKLTGASVPMSLTFSDATHGTLTMGDVIVPILRFQEF